MRNISCLLALLLLLSIPGLAQDLIGQKLPELHSDKIINNDGYSGFDAYKGKLVLVEFFSTH